MQEFEFFIPDSEEVSVTKHLVSIVQFHSEYLVYIEECYVDCTDEKTGVKVSDQLRKHWTMQLRSEITGCSKHWFSKAKVWGVEINMRGLTENLNPCFKREYKAQEFADALIEWLLKKSE